MASLLFVSEYTQNSVDVPTLVMEPSVASQVVNYAGGTTQSTAFRNDTRMVRIHTDTNCFIKFGTNPTATTAVDARMAANQTEYFKVNPGFKVAAVG
jgi:hypothetical protein